MTGALEAGASKRDISPDRPLFLVGYPHVERISTGVHDPLEVCALALRSGSSCCLIAALDLLFVSPATARELRESIGERLQIPPEAIFIGCTHTHSGPVTNEVLAWKDDPVVSLPDAAYMEGLRRKILRCAEEAYARLEPAEIATTAARAEGVGSNRLDPSGPADREVGIIVVRARADRRPLGLVTTYAMHPTVLHEDSTLVSADFPGAMRRHLASRLGEQLVVVSLTGTAGNQSPRYSVSANTFAEAERLGRRLAGSVLEALGTQDERAFRSQASLGAALRSVELPLRRLPSPAEAEAVLRSCRQTFDSLRSSGAPRPEVRTAECAVFGAEETVSLSRAQAAGRLQDWMRSYTPATVQALRIGSTSLVGLPGELFVEYGLEIKRRAPRPTMIASLVNGDLQGYIVTPEAVRAGTYEALLSLFEPQAGGRLVEAALGLLGP